MKQLENEICNQIIDEWVAEAYKENLELIRAINSEEFEKCSLIKEKLNKMKEHVAQVLLTYSGVDVTAQLNIEEQYIYNRISEEIDKIEG